MGGVISSSKDFRRGMFKKETGPRVNEQIRCSEVRLIGADGHQYGVVSIHQARLIADDAGLDLIEVSPNSSPPVVKIMDYGKYKYQKQKKESDAKKKQATVEVKEIKFRPNIEKHDLDVKLKKIDKFLKEGDKVKLLMQFRGREMAHQDIGREKFNDILQQVLGLGATVESDRKQMGNRIFAMVAPVKK